MKIGYKTTNLGIERPTPPGCRWFRLATPDVDSYGTIILPAGVRTARYRANPVFCWMHPLDPERKTTPTPFDVIGKTVQIEQSDQALDLLVKFADHEVAQICREQVEGGFLNAVSLDVEILRQEDRVIDGEPCCYCPAGP